MTTRIMITPELSPRQEEYHKRILQFMWEKRVPPNAVEIAAMMGVCRTAAHKNIRRLVKAGAIEIDERGRIRFPRIWICTEEYCAN